METKDEMAQRLVKEKQARRAQRLRHRGCPPGCRQPIQEGEWRCPVHDPETKNVRE